MSLVKTGWALAALVLAIAARGQSCGTPITTFPYLETFDGSSFNGTTTPPPGWVQDPADGGGSGPHTDWYFNNLPTTSANTGPSADHTTGLVGVGYFAYVEDSSGGHPSVNLLSPCFDLTASSTAQLKFWVHSFDVANPSLPGMQNELAIDVVRFPPAGPPSITTVSTIGQLAAPAWEARIVDLTPFIGTPFRIRFRGRTNLASFTHDIAIDDVQILDDSAAIPSFDVAVNSIDGPGDAILCGSTLGTQTIDFTMLNAGATAIPAGAPLGFEYAIDGGAPISEMIMAPAGGIPVCASVQLSFATPANFTNPGTATVVVSFVGGDGNGANDVAARSIVTGIPSTVTVSASTPFGETFDDFGATQQTTNPPVCWDQQMGENGGGTDSDWYFRSGGTPTFGTGPSADHTTGSGFYAYTEDSIGNHAAIGIDTPPLDISGLTTPTLRFWVHSNNGLGGPGPGENFLSVDVVHPPTGVSIPDALGPIGHLGDQWVEQTVDLTPYLAFGTVRLRFRSRSDGGSFLHDIAIDDISVVEAAPGPGQPAQPGVATLTINDSRNAGGFAASSGQAGPYFASAAVGGIVAMTIEGQPNQIVVLLNGTLNPAATAIPPFGQIDLGGPGLSGVAVLASGADPGVLNSLFIVSPAGRLDVISGVPVSLAGFVSGFQAIVFHPILTIGVSNSVELTIS